MCSTLSFPAKAGRPARTYIQQLCEDTGCSPEDRPEAMNDREKWRERVRDIRATSMTWWLWWWYIHHLIWLPKNLLNCIFYSDLLNMVNGGIKFRKGEWKHKCLQVPNLLVCFHWCLIKGNEKPLYDVDYSIYIVQLAEGLIWCYGHWWCDFHIR